MRTDIFVVIFSLPCSPAPWLCFSCGHFGGRVRPCLGLAFGKPALPPRPSAVSSAVKSPVDTPHIVAAGIALDAPMQVAEVFFGRAFNMLGHD
jgi:hypothetical protein